MAHYALGVMTIPVAILQTSSGVNAAPETRSLAADPQFWIVTIIAIAALIFILRALLPKLGIRRAKGTSTRAQLTIERRKPE